MTARRGECRYCHRHIAIGATGRLWDHGSGGGCPGAHQFPTGITHHWPARHYGRRVTTIPGPDTWNPKETAA
ncbi:hypothetical protein [Streptomyces sp. NPDC018055]|uniref:hypothetical protein n=1 Tax=Streptomyces sp. NPDC018055 TaxID=3365038 RepID=UPI0037BC445C